LDFLLTLDEDSWDGDDLVRLVEGWRLELHAPERLQTVLFERVSEKTSLSHLAYLYFALENLGPVDRRSFFEQCGRWPKKGFPEIPTVSVPPAGGALTFRMGSPDGEGDDDERPPHVVRFSAAFRLGTTTVTQDQFAAFEENPEAKKGVPAGVSWWEAWLFCRWLGGSLPTEAQWEFACRAGTTSPWSVPESDLESVAWYGEGIQASPHPVACKKPNAWGLFDMHGNVWEWCSDRIGPYSEGDQTDPAGPASGTGRVLRGGAYWDVAVWCRSAYRLRSLPGLRRRDFGFRVALSAPRAVDAR
jgi:formylglycine-generating enzyme required for sulfatase activity